MTSPEVNHGYCANIFARQMHFQKAGDVEQGHIHDYDHATLLAAGSLWVTAGTGPRTLYHWPTLIFIDKGVKHLLEAAEDNTVAYCIHIIDRKEAEGLEPFGLNDPRTGTMIGLVEK